MFKRRKTKNQKTQLAIFNCNNELLFKGELDSLPIKEAVIIRKSIEFFNDNSPCYIHRGAVTVRLLGEIEAYMKMHAENFFIFEGHTGSVIDYIDMEAIHRVEIS